jgi:hypothetical protein
MAKYTPLIEHLQKVSGERLRLDFRKIEEIIGDQLPLSARRHQAWWANSTTKDSHTWSHAWQAAGWRAQATLANGTVEFTRVPLAPPSKLEALLPSKKLNVMDLVAQAQIDVVAWQYVDGQPYAQPSSNPNFCYNWSFGSQQEGYVLCVWHKSLSERNGRIVYDCDIASHTRRLRQEFARSGLDGRQRLRLLNQIRRSEAFEAAVANAYYSARPLKLILNLGDTRDDDEFADASSRVSERELDPELWYAHTLAEGDALIVRSEAPPTLRAPDSGADLTPPESPGEDDSWREGQIRVRRGQGAFRDKLLETYGRRCAVTGTILEPILEAAHIVPHAEGTNYRTNNGLLLRADIHTLFDLHHLSIDGRGVVHLSRVAMQSDYRQYHGKSIRLPARSSEQPYATNLDSRHERFLARERERV